MYRKGFGGWGVFALGVPVLLVGVMVIQQVFPTGSFVPFALVNNHFVAPRSANNIASLYSKNQQASITLKVDGESYSYPINDLGVNLDKDRTAERFRVESRLKRLIPFSMLSQMFGGAGAVYTADPGMLELVVGAITDGLHTDPHDAVITFSDNMPTAGTSHAGNDYDAKKLADEILTAIEKGRPEVSLDPTTIDEDISTKELQEALSAFQHNLPASITLAANGRTVPMLADTFMSLVSFAPVKGKPVIGLDPARLSAYTEQIQPTLTNDPLPTPTIVSVSDGNETGRINGKQGKRIDAAKLKTDLEAAITNHNSSVAVNIITADSPLTYAYSYSHTPEGLQKLLDQITKDKEISIRYIDLTDRGWDVGSRAHATSRMASTYKLFVLYSVLKRVDEGKMKLTDQVIGRSVDACLQTIIIDSNNECSIALAGKIGWKNVWSEGKALGAVDMNWNDDLIGTVSDAVVIPLKLARNEILSEQSRNYLLDLMKRQRFREGIPAGTKSQVADKVGFIDGWLNDTGIVYDADKPYVLAIYTYGESWDLIAQITREIENVVQ